MCENGVLNLTFSLIRSQENFLDSQDDQLRFSICLGLCFYLYLFLLELDTEISSVMIFFSCSLCDFSL